MGLLLYGRKWQLNVQHQNGIGAHTMPGSRSVDIDYSDILIFNRDRRAIVVDDKIVFTYSYARQDWIGYDSKFSIKGKVHYAKDHALGVGTKLGFEHGEAKHELKKFQVTWSTKNKIMVNKTIVLNYHKYLSQEGNNMNQKS